MFNMFRKRDTVVRYLLMGLLGLVALSLVTYLVPNTNPLNDPNSMNPVLAEVGSQRIYAAEVQSLFEKSTQGQIPPEMREIYFPQFLDRVIQERASLYQAEQMGLTVSDDEVRAGIALNFPTYYVDGKLNRAALDAALAQQGLTAQMLIDQIRQQMLLRKLQDVLIRTSLVSPAELEAEFRKKKETITLEYLSFTPADMRGKVNVSDEELRARYEADKASFTQPEKYGFRALVLEQEKLASTIQLTEQELRAAYNGSLDNFRTGERMRARHILLGTKDKSDAEKKTLLAKAEELVKQAKGGADFAELAKKNSTDSNAEQGGDLGFFSRGQFPPGFEAFEPAAFALKPNEISGVVTTSEGYHVIQALEKEPARVEPFEKVRADLEKDLRGQRVADRLQAGADKMRADLAKNPAGAADIAKASGAELITVGETAAGQPIPTLGVSPEIDQAVRLLQPGGVSELMFLPGERIAVVVLDRRIPGRPSELREVQAELKDKMMTEGADRMVLASSQSAADRASRGESFAAIAKSLNKPLVTSIPFNRDATISALGPAYYLETAFTQPVGSVVGPIEIQGRTIVAKTIAKGEPDMTGFAEDRPKLLEQLKDIKARERNALLMDGILTKLTNDGKIVKHQEEIQRIMANYSTRR